MARLRPSEKPSRTLDIHTSLTYILACRRSWRHPNFSLPAKRAGMTEEERFAAIDFVAEHPEAGDLLEGSGGARKVRVPRAGGGKSGGYRVVTYHMDDNVPVFLLTVISKGQRANLTTDQKKRVKASAKDAKAKRRRT